MKLYTEELYNLYMKWVDNVPDEKSIFTPKEIVNAIANIIETNPSLIVLPSDKEIENNAYTDRRVEDLEYHEQIGFERGALWMKEQILNQNK